MATISTDLDQPAAARVPFTPSADLPASDVQRAIEILRGLSQPQSPVLDALATLVLAADKGIYFDSATTAATFDLTAFARTVLAAANAAAARTVLELVIGTDVQAYSATLAAIAGLAVTDSNIIVGNGTTWVAETGATARTSLGVGTGNSPQFTGVNIGHASDTTVTRVAAGRIAVEGAELAKLPNLAATTAANGASLIGIEDSGSYFSAATVEGALAYLGAAVAALDQAVVLKGSWSAAGGTFPGSGAAQAGWSYIVSADGTVGGIEFVTGDRIVALIDNASTSTYAANWLKLDYTDRVSSVAGKTGAVTLQVANITDMSANGRSLVAAADYAAMMALLGGSAGENVALNGDFQINQRSFAGGALAAGDYGHDRWKAATGGANYSVSGYTVSLSSGALQQPIDIGEWGYASLASTQVTVSIESPSKDLGISFGSQSGTITAGAGRRSVTLTLGAGDTGDLVLTVDRSADDGVTFGRVKLEVGPSATGWSARPHELELCQKYYELTGYIWEGPVTSGSDYIAVTTIGTKRAVPVITATNATAVLLGNPSAVSISGRVVVRRRRASGTGAASMSGLLQCDAEM